MDLYLCDLLKERLLASEESKQGAVVLQAIKSCNTNEDAMANYPAIKSTAAVIGVISAITCCAIELPTSKIVGEVSEGNELTLECSYASSKPISECTFTNPADKSETSGELVEDGKKCIKTIDALTTDHFGTWECKLQSSDDSMFAVAFIAVTDQPRVRDGIRLPTHLKPARYFLMKR